MKLINTALLNTVSEQAHANARLRINYNLHDTTADPFNRFLNAFQPDTYIRPHRHTSPPKSEGIIVLRGELAALIFDDNGAVKQIEIINPAKGVFAMDIAPAEWHMFIVLAPDTVVYEAKAGPYAPLAECDWAKWAPLPDNKKEVEAYIESFKGMINNLL